MDNNLLAVPFDPGTGDVTGGPVSMVEGVGRFSISDEGTLVYIPGTTSLSDRTLVWVDRKGKEEPLAAESNDYRRLKISPDGTKVALAISVGGSQDAYVWDIIRENMSKLTCDEADDCSPLRRRIGREIVAA